MLTSDELLVARAWSHGSILSNIEASVCCTSKLGQCTTGDAWADSAAFLSLPCCMNGTAARPCSLPAHDAAARAPCCCSQRRLQRQRAVVAGVSSHNQAPAQKVKIRAWRDSMEFFLIHHYRQCLPILREYDLVGERHIASMEVFPCINEA